MIVKGLHFNCKLNDRGSIPPLLWIYFIYISYYKKIIDYIANII